MNPENMICTMYLSPFSGQQVFTSVSPLNSSCGVVLGALTSKHCVHEKSVALVVREVQVVGLSAGQRPLHQVAVPVHHRLA